MPLIKRNENFYQSLIPPPPGYRLEKTELLQAGEGPTPEEDEIYRALGLDSLDFLDKLMVFRCIVEGPHGRQYTSSVIDSAAVLCRKEFWRDFWRQVLKAK